MYRFRIVFSKVGDARFAGHLDLHKSWERTLRRAGTPLAYSEGFHPQPKIQLASALPLGFTSSAEVADIWLREEWDAQELKNRVIDKLPPGIEVQSVGQIIKKEKSLQSKLRAAEYQVQVECEVEVSLIDRVDSLLAKDEIHRVRRGKEYDLRPLVEKLEVDSHNEQVSFQLSMRLTARERATGRPEEVLSALGLDECRTQIHRSKLIFIDNGS